MQNHGGYEGTFDEFDQTVWLTGDMEGKVSKSRSVSVSSKAVPMIAFAYLLGLFQSQR